MNAEWKEKWIAALRSGKYEQAQGTLRRGDAYCCLGVACDIYGVTWKRDKSLIWEWAATLKNGAEWSINLMPKTVWSAFDISLVKEGILTNMNDSGQSFEEIADYIEENL